MTGIETGTAMWLMAGASAVQVVSTLASGAQQQKMANYNAKVAENAAQGARNQAEIEVQKLRRRQASLNSTQIAATAGSGVNVEGSPLLVMADSAGEAEYDAELIACRAVLRAPHR